MLYLYVENLSSYLDQKSSVPLGFFELPDNCLDSVFHKAVSPLCSLDLGNKGGFAGIIFCEQILLSCKKCPRPPHFMFIHVAVCI